jgi:UDP-glucose 4-epimerase
LKHPAELRSERVVVTGGAGFIGSHLCDALIERDNTVICVDNLVGTGGSAHNVDHLLHDRRFELLTEDVVDWATRADLSEVDCVFHLAASKKTVSLSDPEHDLTVNALGTLRLLQQAARCRVRRFVHGSTGSVFGETGPHVEDGPTTPVSVYGVSKLAGESYCRVIGQMFGLNHTVLRYYNVVGPRQDASERGGVVPIFARRCLSGLPLTIHGTGAQTRSFTSVHDVVRATLLAATSDRMLNESFNCASGISVSIRVLADFVISETGSTRQLEFEPARPGDIQRLLVDNTRIRSVGVEFDTDWHSFVRETIRSVAASVLPARTRAEPALGAVATTDLSASAAVT